MAQAEEFSSTTAIGAEPQITAAKGKAERDKTVPAICYQHGICAGAFSRSEAGKPIPLTATQHGKARWPVAPISARFETLSFGVFRTRPMIVPPSYRCNGGPIQLGADKDHAKLGLWVGRCHTVGKGALTCSTRILRPSGCSSRSAPTATTRLKTRRRSAPQARNMRGCGASICGRRKIGWVRTPGVLCRTRLGVRFPKLPA